MQNEQIEADIVACLKDLRTLDFQTPLPQRFEHVAESIQVGQTPKRNVYFLGGSWVVKYFFAGKQRAFRSFPAHQYAEAYRLADMVIRLFADLRVRKPKPLDDNSFNYSPEQAQRDLDQEPAIHSVLLQLHALSPEPQQRPFERRRTAHQEFKKMLQQLDRIESTVEDLKKEVSRLTALVPSSSVS